MPIAFKEREFQKAVAALPITKWKSALTRANWTNEAEALRAEPALTAANIVSRSMSVGMRERIVRARGEGTNGRFRTASFARNSFFFAQDPPMMPKVITTATATAWVVHLSLLRYAVERAMAGDRDYRLREPKDELERERDNEWMNHVIREGEGDEYIYEEDVNNMFTGMYESVNTYVCKRTYSDEVMPPVCLDLFISDKAAWPLAGDNRNFDPYAPPTMSRAQIYVDPTNPSNFRVYINGSKIYGTGMFMLDGTKFSTVTVEPLSGGGVRVTWSLANGYCTVALNDVLCPHIDGHLDVAPPGPDGLSQMSGMRDAFPELGVYQYKDGQWKVRVEQPHQARPYAPDWFNLYQTPEVPIPLDQCYSVA